MLKFVRTILNNLFYIIFMVVYDQDLFECSCFPCPCSTLSNIKMTDHEKPVTKTGKTNEAPRKGSKAFLGALFAKSLKTQSGTSLLSNASSQFNAVTEVPISSCVSETSGHTGNLLEEYHVTKAGNLDAIFAKAALETTAVRDDGAENEDSLRVDALVPFPDELPAVYAVLIEKLETSVSMERFMPFTLRRLHEFGYEKLFIDYVMTRIKARDKEIEHVCASNALVLTESTRDFVNISEQVDELRQGIITVDDRDIYESELRHIKFAGKGTKTTSNILVNVAMLIERISSLRPTLTHFEEAQPFAAQGEPVKALRKLATAQHNSIHLPYQITFVTWLAEAIPDMKFRLIVAAVQGVTKTLEALRANNVEAGFATLRNVCQINHIYIDPYNPKEIPANANDDKSIASYDNKSMASSQTKESLVWSIHEVINLRPLHHFRHVMLSLIENPDGLDIRFLFECYLTYMAERQNQVLAKLRDPEILLVIENLRAYFENIVGLFAAEMYVSYMVPGISSELYYNEIWKQAALVIRESLESSVSIIQDEDSYREVRDLTRLFIQTLYMLRCETGELYAAFETFGNYYNNLLLSELIINMERILISDKFYPMILHNEQEKASLEVTFDCWVFPPITEAIKYPLKLPFSKSVPDLYELIKTFISRNVGVCEDVNLSLQASEERLVELTLTVLIKYLRELMNQVLEHASLSPTQYVQFYINCKFLQSSCGFFKQHIADSLKTSTSNFGDMQAKYELAFKRLQADAEHQLSKDLAIYIDKVLRLCRFDTPKKHDTPSAEAEHLMKHIQKLIDVSNMMCRPFLQRLLMEARARIPRVLETVLVQESKAISVDGLNQLKIDIELYESLFWRLKEYSPNTHLLKDAFVSLHQLIEVVTLEDWSNYMANVNVRGSHYDRVTPDTALKILSKLKDTEDRAGSNIFIHMKADREKKKRREAITIQLQDLLGIRHPKVVC